jgi:hypothetical protein
MDPPMLLTASPAPERTPAVDAEAWFALLDVEGRVRDPTELRRLVHSGGLDDTVRADAWKFLCGMYSMHSSYEERASQRAHYAAEYARISETWRGISAEQECRNAAWRDRRHRIEKDVLRTDRDVPFFAGKGNANVATLFDLLVTYSFYAADVGYCQGMSDIMAPMLYVLKDEVDAFWCFARHMDHVGSFFHRDQHAIHRQLRELANVVRVTSPDLHTYLCLQGDAANYFFAFRWLLLWFKRELSFEETLRLWDCVLTRFLSDHFAIFIAAGVIARERKAIVNNRMQMDDLVRHVNSLAGAFEVDRLLIDGEVQLAMVQAYIAKREAEQAEIANAASAAAEKAAAAAAATAERAGGEPSNHQ